jgi:DNA-binding GntR family transcriptional regulator
LIRESPLNHVDDESRAEPPPPLGASVYAVLKSQILAGAFVPGTKLGEEELAARFSISRTPLRAVLSRLEQDGLVSVYPRRGAFTAVYSKADILEILQLREVLEGLVSRLAARYIDKPTLAELKSLFSSRRVREMRSDPNVLALADQQFHATLVRCSRNRRLSSVMAKLNDQMQLVRMRTITLPGRLDQSIREHQGMIAALAAGDETTAEQRARRHIRNVMRAVVDRYEEVQPIKENG